MGGLCKNLLASECILASLLVLAMHGLGEFPMELSSIWGVWLPFSRLMPHCFSMRVRAILSFSFDELLGFWAVASSDR